MGRGFSFEELMPALDRLIDTYLAMRIDPSEAFVSAVERLGTIPFQEALYAIDKPA
jgi:sulfite reductase (NADPH) hemoprotein beta-component